MPALAKHALTAAAALALYLGTTGRAEAQFIVTLEQPRVQATTVEGAQTETFDDLGLSAGKYHSLSSSIGTYTAPGSTDGIAIVNHDEYGGSNSSQYVSIGSQSGQTQMTLNLNGGQRYFGFEWLAGDRSNVITLYDGTRSLGSYNIGNLIDIINQRSDKSQYYGNPNNTRQDPSEPFAYVNLFTTSGTFDKIVFSNSNSVGTGFETDNHSISATLPTVLPGDVVAMVPEPATYISSGTALLFGLGYARRRKALAPDLQGEPDAA